MEVILEKLLKGIVIFSLIASVAFFIVNCSDPESWGGENEVDNKLLGNWALDTDSNGVIDSTIDQLDYFVACSDSIDIGWYTLPNDINGINEAPYFRVKAFDGQIYNKYVGPESPCPDRYRYDYTLVGTDKMYLVIDTTSEATDPNENTDDVEVLLKQPN